MIGNSTGCLPEGFSDLENLILKVKNKVLEKTGIILELEVQIIGDKS